MNRHNCNRHLSICRLNDERKLRDQVRSRFFFLASSTRLPHLCACHPAGIACYQGLTCLINNTTPPFLYRRNSLPPPLDSRTTRRRRRIKPAAMLVPGQSSHATSRSCTTHLPALDARDPKEALQEIERAREGRGGKERRGRRKCF